MEEATEAFDRILQVEQMALQDANESMDSENSDDIRFYEDSLSKSVGFLEEQLSNVLKTAADDSSISIDEIRKYRTEQKTHINEFKRTISNLQRKADSIEESTSRRRRVLEDEDRQREMRWLDQRFQMEQRLQVLGESQPSSQSCQPDDNVNQASQRPPAGPIHNMQYAPTALPIINEDVESSDTLTPPPHVDELPGAHEHSSPQSIDPQHTPMGQQPISAQPLRVEPSFSGHPPSQHVCQQGMSASGLISAQQLPMPPDTPPTLLPSSYAHPAQRIPHQYAPQPMDFVARHDIQQLRQQVMKLQTGAAASPVNPPNKPVAVKLQRYTITPFRGNFRDWLRFWNQFSVEVDQSGLPEISKFNYLLELCKGEPLEAITGLPHTAEGYEAAKGILTDTYGKSHRVKRTFIQDLEELPTIPFSSNRIERAHSFYKALSKAVRTLHTMGALSEVEGLTYTLLDKLGPIKEPIIMRDDNWESWKLQDLVTHLGRYVDRNPLSDKQLHSETSSRSGGANESRNSDRYDRKPGGTRKDKGMMGTAKSHKCVYCQNDKHFSDSCTKVLDVQTRREILGTRKLCFNCTSPKHFADKCQSTKSCYHCKRPGHHSSICNTPRRSSMGDIDDQDKKNAGKSNEKGYSSYSGSAIHPSAVVKAGNKDVRVVMDTLSGSNYIGTDLIAYLNLKPKRKERRSIEQMYGTVDKLVEIYQLTITSKINATELSIECINAERDLITHLPNPQIRKMKKDERWLQGLLLAEEESQERELPVHILLGVRDYTRIKDGKRPVMGKDSDAPIAESTRFGWVISGGNLKKHGREFCQFRRETVQHEFEQLCSIDVLGLTESKMDSTAEFNHDMFKRQITLTDGSYTTHLPWKKDHVELPDNKELSLKRLQSTVCKLQKSNKLEDYHDIMTEQLESGVLEPVPTEEPTSEMIHYIPHHGVIKPD